jgi:hypothetical protein
LDERLTDGEGRTQATKQKNPLEMRGKYLFIFLLTGPMECPELREKKKKKEKKEKERKKERKKKDSALPFSFLFFFSSFLFLLLLLFSCATKNSKVLKKEGS